MRRERDHDFRWEGATDEGAEEVWQKCVEVRGDDVDVQEGEDVGESEYNWVGEDDVSMCKVVIGIRMCENEKVKLLETVWTWKMCDVARKSGCVGIMKCEVT